MPWKVTVETVLLLLGVLLCLCFSLVLAGVQQRGLERLSNVERFVASLIRKRRIRRRQSGK